MTAKQFSKPIFYFDCGDPMTPNPHLASGNGGVIERARRIIEIEIARVVCLFPEADGDSVMHIKAAEKIAGLLAAAGLLRADERLEGYREGLKDGAASEEIFGSGDGKVREALGDLLDAHIDYVVEQGTHDPDEEPAVKDARKALATPAPSPIDAEGMREECAKLADDFDWYSMGSPNDIGPNAIEKTGAEIAKAIRALPTPAREIDRDSILNAIRFSEDDEDAANRILSLIGGRHG